MTIRLIDANEVSAITNFTPNTIRRMARQGRIPSRRVGHRIRFVRDEIEQWLTELPTGVAS